jgi:uncharacterized protein DUF5678
MSKPIDWSHLYKNYRGKWVALADDEVTVLASGETAKEAYEGGLKHSKIPILHRVPVDLDIVFVGYAI